MDEKAIAGRMAADLAPVMVTVLSFDGGRWYPEGRYPMTSEQAALKYAGESLAEGYDAVVWQGDELIAFGGRISTQEALRHGTGTVNRLTRERRPVRRLGASRRAVDDGLAEAVPVQPPELIKPPTQYAKGVVEAGRRGTWTQTARELIASGSYADGSREGELLAYLYGHRASTPFEISRDMSLEIDEAKAVYELMPELAGRSEAWLLGQIRKVLAKGGSSPNPLDGMSNEKARKEVYKLMAHYSKGIFTDEYWAPVDAIFKAMKAAGLDWVMTGTQYRSNDRGTPSSKEWKFEVSFVNANGRRTTLRGTIVASGAGSVEQPLDRYDLVTMVY